MTVSLENLPSFLRTAFHLPMACDEWSSLFFSQSSWRTTGVCKVPYRKWSGTEAKAVPRKQNLKYPLQILALRTFSTGKYWENSLQKVEIFCQQYVPYMDTAWIPLQISFGIVCPRCKFLPADCHGTSIYFFHWAYFLGKIHTLVWNRGDCKVSKLQLQTEQWNFTIQKTPHGFTGHRFITDQHDDQLRVG